MKQNTKQNLLDSRLNPPKTEELFEDRSQREYTFKFAFDLVQQTLCLCSCNKDTNVALVKDTIGSHKQKVSEEEFDTLLLINSFT